MASSNPDSDSAPLLCATDLRVRVGRQWLLQGANFSVRRGELVVLVGPSGTGKSVLLKLIAGILRPRRRSLRAEGKLLFDGVDLLRRRPPRGRIGILFQDPALFDEWKALENVRFGERHRGRGRSGPASEALLEHLGVDVHADVRTLSGGQQQRVSLARALALSPELLLYDEPTTGLDPSNAARVAALLQQTHREGQTAALIVTHDVDTLAPIADRVLLLDPATGTIQPVAKEVVRERLRGLDSTPAPAAPLLAPGPGTRWLEGSADVLLGTLLALLRLIPTASPRLSLRFGLRWLRLCLSPAALAYFAIAGAVVGFVATHFTFVHLPNRGFTEPLFIDDILRALGFLLYRVLCPVILTVLIAARTGAAIASEIGNKSYAGQLDAMRSLGAKPSRSLLTSLLWAALLTTPLLYVAMFATARFVSLGVFIYGHPEETAFFWDRNFHRSLSEPGALLWVGSWWLLLKLELCAFGTAAIAWFQGMRFKDSAGDVSNGVTRTVIAASLFVLLVHFGLAFLEF